MHVRREYNSVEDYYEVSSFRITSIDDVEYPIAMPPWDPKNHFLSVVGKTKAGIKRVVHKWKICTNISINLVVFNICRVPV